MMFEDQFQSPIQPTILILMPYNPTEVSVIVPPSTDSAISLSIHNLNQLVKRLILTIAKQIKNC